MTFLTFACDLDLMRAFYRIYGMFFCVILLLRPGGLFAQKDYVVGYVIKNSGDTMRGKIKDRKFVSGEMSWQKIFFLDSAGNKYVYHPEDIKEYGRRGRQRYRTIVIGVDAKPTFLQLREDGPVLLYTWNHGSWGGAGNAVRPDMKQGVSKLRVDFYLTLQGLPLPASDDRADRVECFLQFRDKPASLMQWRPRDYKQTAKTFFGDNAEIMQLINSDALNENDIYAITRKYNLSKK